MSKELIKILLGLKRSVKISIIFLIDLLITNISFLSAYFAKFSEIDSLFTNINSIYFLIFANLLTIPIFLKFGVHKNVVRFVNTNFIKDIFISITFLVSLLLIIIYLFSIKGVDIFPVTVLSIFWFQVIIFIIASRFIGKWLLSFSYANIENRNIIIYGAGVAGINLLYALSKNNQYNIIGFFDDDRNISNQVVAGKKVYSPSQIDYLNLKFKVDEVLIAMPSISVSKKKEILEKLSEHNISVRSLPSFSELVNKKLNFSNLKNLDINDLLERSVVSNKNDILSSSIKGKNILISGSGGSIGSELARQVLLNKPKIIVLLERNEFSLYSIFEEFGGTSSNKRIIPILDSVLNHSQIIKYLNKYQIDFVFHAAAYKHVPMIESNIESGIKNNVIGTYSLAKAAIKCNVSKFILVSTDKAVRPTNYMGATKRFSEIVIQSIYHQNKRKNCDFSIIRFGNVLGSSGSVIPLFDKQILSGGPVTVTDPNVMRYFMTIPEAAELLLQAGFMARGCESFVLDMGEPVKIVDLAEKMIKLNGLKLKNNDNPGGDIEIKFTGLRPGEKLYEELLISGNLSKTKNHSIYKIEEPIQILDDVDQLIKGVKRCLDSGNLTCLKKIVKKVVPEYHASNGKLNQTLDS